MLYVQDRAQEMEFCGSREHLVLAKKSTMMAGDE